MPSEGANIIQIDSKAAGGGIPFEWKSLYSVAWRIETMVRNLSARDILAVLAIVALTGAGSYLLPWALPMVQAAETWLADFRFATLSAPEPQDDRIVIVTITEDTLASLPYRSPLDREFLAKLLGSLEAAKPRAIGFDVLFDQKTQPAKDAALKRRLLDSPVPIVVAAPAVSNSDLTERQAAYLKVFTDGLDVGLVNLVTDRAGGTVRWIFAGETVDGQWKPGFVGAIAGAIGLEAPRQDTPLAYRGRPGKGEPAFRKYQAHTVGFMPKKWFAGKIILIGADIPRFDRHRTPYSAAEGAEAGGMPGVFIHAHGLAQLLDGRVPSGLGAGAEAALILLLAAAGMLFAALDMPLTLKAGGFLIAIVLYWVGGFALYHYGGIMFPLLTPSLGFAASSGVGITFLGRRDRKQKKFIRQAFSRYVSPGIVDQLVADPSQMNPGGERRELTYLFTDLANFTSLTEKTEPAVLVPLLNEYLSEMCRILFKHGATIDKIVGDAVVGFFNAPIAQEDHPARAVAAALELDEFGQAFVEKQAELARIVGITRIGVHSGVAVIGNFGGEAFFDYTAHGDMVNTAARLESVNKHLGTRICISGVTAGRCPEMAFRPVGELVLKGKSEGIEVFEPLADGWADGMAIAAYTEAFEKLRRNDPGAGEAFREVIRINPDDGLAKFHLGRLEEGETGAKIVMEDK